MGLLVERAQNGQMWKGVCGEKELQQPLKS